MKTTKRSKYTSVITAFAIQIYFVKVEINGLLALAACFRNLDMYNKIKINGLF